MSVHHLKPAWKPGQSGNPLGINIPKGAWQELNRARAMCAEKTPEAVEMLLHLMRTAKRDETRGWAAAQILDRGGLKAALIEAGASESDENGEKVMRVKFVGADAG